MGLRNAFLALIIAAVLILPSTGKPSFFEKKKVDTDLDQLEALLSGKGGRVNVAEAAHINSSVTVGEPETRNVSMYEPPYASLFRNDDNFQEFRKELEGIGLPQVNATWADLFLEGNPFLDLNASGEAQMASGRTHKPILLKEPDF